MSGTKHKVLIRKHGDKAIIITLSDWYEFAGLEALAPTQSNPDFLLTGITTNSINTDWLPNTVYNISGATNITDDLQGKAIADIMQTKIWNYKRIKPTP